MCRDSPTREAAISSAVVLPVEVPPTKLKPPLSVFVGSRRGPAKAHESAKMKTAVTGALGRDIMPPLLKSPFFTERVKCFNRRALEQNHFSFLFSDGLFREHKEFTSMPARPIGAYRPPLVLRFRKLDVCGQLLAQTEIRANSQPL